MWAKIEDFQKKGGLSRIKEQIDTAKTFVELNGQMIGAMQKDLTDEEQEDAQLRAQHGAQFARPPSDQVNAAYKKSLADY